MTNKTSILRTLILLVIFSSFFACKQDKGVSRKRPPQNVKEIRLKYAKGFSVAKNDNYTVLKVTKPWPNADKPFKYALINQEDSASDDIMAYLNETFDGVVILPLKKIVTTSTTHLPALELLNKEETIVGFPGTNYISSETIRSLVDSGNIRELGKNESLNTEVVLELNPDLLVGFGIDGGNPSLETIKNSGIPVIFNGDWVESSPLAKAEWIKFFGVLFDKEKAADSIFNHIEASYLEAKKIAHEATTKPSVLSGAMHGDVWYLPNGTSTEAQLLKDANVNYLWSDTEGSGSLKLNFESVFVKGKHADIWFNPSIYSSMESLKNSNENHALFDAFANKSIFTFTKTIGATGGVLYYELGMTRPDLVLKDIIKICHPELLEDYTPFFYKPLP